MDNKLQKLGEDKLLMIKYTTCKKFLIELMLGSSNNILSTPIKWVLLELLHLSDLVTHESLLLVATMIL